MIDPKAIEAAIERIIQDACELPDRTSPEDQPDMLLITGEELDMLLRRHLGLEDSALMREALEIGRQATEAARDLFRNRGEERLAGMFANDLRRINALSHPSPCPKDESAGK